MKRRWHLSVSGITATVLGYRSVMGFSMAEGTGQTVRELAQAGWTRLEIARYFPWTNLEWLLLGGVILYGGYHAHKGKHAH